MYLPKVALRPIKLGSVRLNTYNNLAMAPIQPLVPFSNAALLRVRAQALATAYMQSRPQTLLDPGLNPAVAKRIEEEYGVQNIDALRTAGQVVGGIGGAYVGAVAGAKIGAGVGLTLGNITGLGLLVPEEVITVPLGAMVGTIVGAAMSFTGAAVGGAVLSPTGWIAAGEIVRNTMLETLKNPAVGGLQTLSVLGNTMDQAFGAPIVKSAIVSLQEPDTEFIDTVFKAYGAHEEGFTQMDFSRIRKNVGIDVGGVGNFAIDFIGELLTDPGIWKLGAIADMATSAGAGGVKTISGMTDDFSQAMSTGQMKKIGRIMLDSLDNPNKAYANFEKYIAANKPLKDLIVGMGDDIPSNTKKLFNIYKDAIAKNFDESAVAYKLMLKNKESVKSYLDVMKKQDPTFDIDNVITLNTKKYLTKRRYVFDTIDYDALLKHYPALQKVEKWDDLATISIFGFTNPLFMGLGLGGREFFRKFSTVVAKRFNKLTSGVNKVIDVKDVNGITVFKNSDAYKVKIDKVRARVWALSDIDKKASKSDYIKNATKDLDAEIKVLNQEKAQLKKGMELEYNGTKITEEHQKILRAEYENLMKIPNLQGEDLDKLLDLRIALNSYEEMKIHKTIADSNIKHLIELKSVLGQLKIYRESLFQTFKDLVVNKEIVVTSDEGVSELLNISMSPNRIKYEFNAWFRKNTNYLEEAMKGKQYAESLLDILNGTIGATSMAAKSQAKVIADLNNHSVLKTIEWDLDFHITELDSPTATLGDILDDSNLSKIIHSNVADNLISLTNSYADVPINKVVGGVEIKNIEALFALQKATLDDPLLKSLDIDPHILKLGAPVEEGLKIELSQPDDLAEGLVDFLTDAYGEKQFKHITARTDQRLDIKVNTDVVMHNGKVYNPIEHPDKKFTPQGSEILSAEEFMKSYGGQYYYDWLDVKLHSTKPELYREKELFRIQKKVLNQYGNFKINNHRVLLDNALTFTKDNELISLHNALLGKTDGLSGKYTPLALMLKDIPVSKGLGDYINSIRNINNTNSLVYGIISNPKFMDIPSGEQGKVFDALYSLNDSKIFDHDMGVLVNSNRSDFLTELGVIRTRLTKRLPESKYIVSDILEELTRRYEDLLVHGMNSDYINHNMIADLNHNVANDTWNILTEARQYISDIRDDYSKQTRKFIANYDDASVLQLMKDFVDLKQNLVGDMRLQLSKTKSINDNLSLHPITNDGYNTLLATRHINPNELASSLRTYTYRQPRTVAYNAQVNTKLRTIVRDTELSGFDNLSFEKRIEIFGNHLSSAVGNRGEALFSPYESIAEKVELNWGDMNKLNKKVAEAVNNLAPNDNMVFYDVLERFQKYGYKTNEGNLYKFIFDRLYLNDNSIAINIDNLVNTLEADKTALKLSREEVQIAFAKYEYNKFRIGDSMQDKAIAFEEYKKAYDIGVQDAKLRVDEINKELGVYVPTESFKAVYDMFENVKEEHIAKYLSNITGGTEDSVSRLVKEFIEIKKLDELDINNNTVQELLMVIHNSKLDVGSKGKLMAYDSNEYAIRQLKSKRNKLNAIEVPKTEDDAAWFEITGEIKNTKNIEQDMLDYELHQIDFEIDQLRAKGKSGQSVYRFELDNEADNIDNLFKQRKKALDEAYEELGAKYGYCDKEQVVKDSRNLIALLSKEDFSEFRRLFVELGYTLEYADNFIKYFEDVIMPTQRGNNFLLSGGSKEIPSYYPGTKTTKMQKVDTMDPFDFESNIGALTPEQLEFDLQLKAEGLRRDMEAYMLEGNITEETGKFMPGTEEGIYSELMAEKLGDKLPVVNKIQRLDNLTYTTANDAMNYFGKDAHKLVAFIKDYDYRLVAVTRESHDKVKTPTRYRVATTESGIDYIDIKDKYRKSFGVSDPQDTVEFEAFKAGKYDVDRPAIKEVTYKDAEELQELFDTQNMELLDVSLMSIDDFKRAKQISYTPFKLPAVLDYYYKYIERLQKSDMLVSGSFHPRNFVDVIRKNSQMLEGIWQTKDYMQQAGKAMELYSHWNKIAKDKFSLIRNLSKDLKIAKDSGDLRKVYDLETDLDELAGMSIKDFMGKYVGNSQGIKDIVALNEQELKTYMYRKVTKRKIFKEADETTQRQMLDEEYEDFINNLNMTDDWQQTTGATDQVSYLQNLSIDGLKHSEQTRWDKEMFRYLAQENPVMKTNMRIGGTIEQVGRLHGYMLDRHLFGTTHDLATARSLRRHFDYSDRSPAELYATLIFPFVAFPTRNMMFWSEQLMEAAKSRRYYHMLNAVWGGYEETGNSEYVQYAKANGYIPLGNTMLKLGDSRFGGQQMTGNPIQTMYNRLNPILKAPLETLRGNGSLGENALKATPILRRIPTVMKSYQASKEKPQFQAWLPSIFGTLYSDNDYANPAWRNRRNMYKSLYTTGGKYRTQSTDAYYRTRQIMYEQQRRRYT